MAELISEVIDPKALQQVAQLTKEVEDLVKTIASAADRARASADDLSQSKTYAQYNRNVRTAVSETGSLIITTEKLKATKAQLNAIEAAGRREAAALNKEIERSIKNNAELASDYTTLSKAYNDAAKKAKDYAAGLGLTNKATQAAVKDAQALFQRILSIDKAVGDSRRNVGNYEGAVNGLRLQVTQIARELPSLASGLSTFAIAIGNNLPMAQEALRNLREENARLRAEGKPTASVFKTLAASIFNWQTALIVLLTVLPGVVKAIQAGGKAAQAAEKANKKYEESLKSIEETSMRAAAEETARIKVLTALAADNAQSTRTRTRAIKELQENYPSYFGNLSKEAILNGQVADAVNSVSEALINKARADAAGKKLGALAEKQLELTLAEAQAQRDVNKAQADYNLLKDRELTEAEKETGVSAAGDASARLANAQITLRDIRANLDDARKVQEQFLKDAVDFSRKAGDVMFGKDPKSPGKRIFDSTKETLDATRGLIAANFDLLKQQIQQDVESQDAIVENENELLEKRLEALRIFYLERRNLVGVEAESDAAQLRASLGKIAEIEKMAATSRTNEQKALLIQKEEFEAQLRVISERAAAESAKLTREEQERIRAITKAHYSAYVQQVLDQERVITNSYKVQFAARKEDLDKQFEQGLITQRQYNKELKKLQKEVTDAATRAQIQFLESQARVIKAAGGDISKLIDEINRLKGVLTVSSDDPERTLFGYDQDEVNKVLAQVNSYQSAANSLFSALQFQSDQRIKAIDAEIDAINRKKEADLKAIETSILSEEDRQRRREEINAKAAAQEEMLNEKRKQEQRAQAQRDKAIKLANAIITGAATVINEYFKGGPASAIAAGIAAAAEIATIIATPIPQYAEGTENHPGGPALYGEAGPELVMEPGKRPRLVETPTISNLAAGTRVIPEKKLATLGFDLINSQMRLPKQKQDHSKEIVEATNRMRKDLVRAFRDNPPIIIQKKGISREYYEKWINGRK